MRKKASVLTVIILCMCVLCACASSSAKKTAEEKADISENVVISRITPEPTEEPVETEEPWAEPTPKPGETPTPTPAASSVSPEVIITKSPTDETVDENGSATFIAKAEFAKSISWIFVSPDAKTWYDAANTSTQFMGLGVDGQGTEILKLTSIPASLDGWRVQCVFTGGDGSQKYTAGAIIKVISAPKDTRDETALALASKCWNDVKKYADASGFKMGEVQNYEYSNGCAEFTIDMTKGITRLTGLFRVYTATNDYYPESIVRYDSGTCTATFLFAKDESGLWDRFGKTISDTAAELDS